jgi:tellurite resistance protein
MGSKKKTAAAATSSIADLEKHADEIRAALKVPKQNDVFRAAVEAAYLAALADGDVDDEERATIVKAVELLSVGAVIQWEAETLLDECEARATKDGAEKRAEAVGADLKSLGHAEAGLLMAAVVARATKGVDKKEAEVLKSVGSAAGLTSDQVRDIVKKAGTLA